MRRFGHNRSAAVRSSVFRLPPSAFTLVELLVVITIISMLMGLLLPAVQSAREAGRRATCLNAQKQLATAALNYESSRRSFPGYANWIGANKTIPASFVVSLFPYMEKQDMYNLWASYDGTTIFDGNNKGFAANPTGMVSLVNPYMKMLVCPSDTPENTTDGWCSYVCNRGCNGWNRPYLGVCLDQATPAGTAPFQVAMDYLNQHDGSSTTLLLGETVMSPTTNKIFVPRTLASDRTQSMAKWTTPSTAALGGTTTGPTNAGNLLSAASSGQYSTSPPGVPTNDMEACVGFEWSQWSATPSLIDKLYSQHPGSTVVSFCDGHQQVLSTTVDVATFMMLMTPWDNGIPGRSTTAGVIANTGTMTSTPTWSGSGTSSTIPSVPLPNAQLDESKFQ